MEVTNVGAEITGGLAISDNSTETEKKNHYVLKIKVISYKSGGEPSTAGPENVQKCAEVI